MYKAIVIKSVLLKNTAVCVKVILISQAVDIMSNIISKQVVCPKCGKTSSVRVYTSINVTTDPQFKKKLLSGDLLRFRCSNCKYEGMNSYPLLYNDMDKRFMVYLIPEIDRFQIEDRELEDDYRNLTGITKRIVSNYNSLKEKIYIFDTGLDDMAIELTKLALAEIVAGKYKTSRVEEGYLSVYSREENTIGFTFFTGRDKTPFVQKARLEIYARSLKIVQDICMNDKKLSGFIKVDREWAENTLFRYKRLKNMK